MGIDELPSADDNDNPWITQGPCKRRNAAPNAREGKGKTTPSHSTYAGVLNAANRGGVSQVAKNKGSPPVGAARSQNLFKSALEGNKDKPGSSKKSKEHSYPPSHPSHGKRTSSFFWGEVGTQRGPKTLVPLDDWMNLKFPVKMSF